MSRGTLIPIFPIPMGYFYEDERPCYHVPPPRLSWLRRLWWHLFKHAPKGLKYLIGYSGREA